MDPSQWIASFRITHEQARKGTLNESELKKYLGMRDELARSLLNSQGLSVPDGVPARRAFTVQHLFPIELAGLYKTMTRELSCKGFVATVGATFKEGDRVSFTMNLSRTSEPLSGNATVTAAQKQGTSVTRITCTYDGLDEERLARLEFGLFDAALSRLGT